MSSVLTFFAPDKVSITNKVFRGKLDWRAEDVPKHGDQSTEQVVRRKLEGVGVALIACGCFFSGALASLAYVMHGAASLVFMLLAPLALMSSLGHGMAYISTAHYGAWKELDE